VSNDTSFILFDASSPGNIGASNPGQGTFRQLDVVPLATNSYGIRILVTDPSTEPSPQAALNIVVASALNTQPALKISNSGSGADIELALGVTLTEVGGQLYLRDTVAGSVSLSSLVGGGGVLMVVGRVEVNAGGITANTTVTSSNTTQLTGAPNGLVPYTDASQFASAVHVYVDGSLMATGLDSSTNNDVYPAGVAANGEMAFEFDLAEGVIIQVVKFVSP